MAEQLLLEEQRENWGSRAGFVLAAIGSAVGLGNLWGFPYKLYAYGGGAFLIPYVTAMLIIGVPVLILEFSLGHMTQRAAPDAFRRVGRKKEPVGWWGILLGFVIITYYAVILAWCLNFLYYSIEGIVWHAGQVPWSGKGAEAVQKTKDFFNVNFLNKWTDADKVKPWTLGSISPQIALSLGIVWILMFLCIFRGVRVVSKVVMWTVPLPWLMLLILAVRGLTLEGSTQGLAYYLNPDWNQLLKPTTWRFAFGQVFFSMSLAFGVMVTYASFLHRKSDINNNATIIGLGDLGTSFVAGIAVFSVLGAMSFATNVAVDGIGVEGPELAFIAFPYALAQMPFGAWFSMVFFIALLTLGIDSAFSITESVLASLVDKTGWNRTATLWGMTFIGFGIGLVYCSRGGLSWLSNIDGFINGPWGIAMLGLLECLVLGWMFRISRLRRHANERSDWKLGAWWDWNIRILVPIVLSALFAWSLYETVTKPDGYLFDKAGELNVPVLVGLILAGLAPLLAVILSMVRSRVGAAMEEESPAAQSPPPARSANGILGGVLAMAGLAAATFGILLTMNGKLAANAGKSISAAMPVYEIWGGDVPLAIPVLIGAAVAGAVAIVLGSVAVVRAEKRLQTPSAMARLAGGGGTIAFGLAGGAAMALYVLLAKIDPGSVKHTKEMSVAAYIILAVMLGIIVVGLGWCFYRALKAAGRGAAEQQPEAG